MKRADEPLDEEVLGLQVALGMLGILLGPLIFGSGLLGLVLGVVGAKSMIRADGAIGLWAREIGAQVSAAGMWLRTEADARNIPNLLSQGRTKASEVWAQCRTEMASFDESAKVSERLRALLARAWAPILAWAQRSGVAARLRTWWLASGLPTWIEQLKANIEQRRKQAT